MLDFIWHLRGSITLSGIASNDVIFDHLENMLDKQGKYDRKRGPEYLDFKDPIWTNFFGPNWLVMVIYDHGHFWIEQNLSERRLHYDLRSLHGMIFCLLVAFFVFFLGFFAEKISEGAKLATIAFGWLYGINILLAFSRVPSAIHKAVKNI